MGFAEWAFGAVFFCCWIFSRLNLKFASRFWSISLWMNSIDGILQQLVCVCPFRRRSLTCQLENRFRPNPSTKTGSCLAGELHTRYYRNQGYKSPLRLCLG